MGAKLGNINVTLPKDFHVVWTSQIADRCDFDNEFKETGGDIFGYDATPVVKVPVGTKRYTPQEIKEIKELIRSISI